MLPDVLLDRALIDFELLDELVDRNSRRIAGRKFCDLGLIQPSAEIAKIGNRLDHFKKVREFWLAHE